MRNIWIGTAALALGVVAVAAGAQDAAVAETAVEETPAVEQAAPAGIPVEQWLLLGPIPVTWPAFHDAPVAGVGMDELSAAWPLAVDELWPRVKDTVAWPGTGKQVWSRQAAGGGALALARPADGAAEALAAVYVQVDHFTAVTLSLTSLHPLALAVDGAPVELAAGEETGPDELAPQTATLDLIPGKHLLLVRALLDPEVEGAWSVAAELQPGEEFAAPVLSTDPARAITIRDVVDAPALESVAIAPDGTRVAVSLAGNLPDGTAERWLEVRRTSDGGLIRTWRGLDPLDQVQWAPRGHTLSYVTRDEESTTLWLHDLDGGAATPLLRDQEDFEAYRWSPDGTFVVVATVESPEPDERQVKRVRDPADRQPWRRDRRTLTQVSVPDGVSRQLTAGSDSPDDWSIAPDGTRLLFLVEQLDWSERPFSIQQLWQLDLATLQVMQLIEDRWIWGAQWSPDMARIVVHGSGSAFGAAGLVVPEGVTPSEFDGQLYLLDPASGAVEPITLDLQPAVQWVAWSRANGKLYALCVDGQLERLFVRDDKKGTWSPVKTAIEVVRQVDLALDAPVAVAAGSGAIEPPRLSVIDLKKGRSRVVLEPAAERHADITMGLVEQWSATLPSGEQLDGRIHYPPDFDPARTYPAIVYYYGGTYPVTRGFGGRYPKNLWAAHGYVVYVVEPSGAVGYGQAFSALHVGEWGERTAGEVIGATEVFLAAHPFVDPARVGCIGASYGGFLTQDIVTRTDLFAAAVSHAGISTLSSYWGEGYWGYEYSAVAMADRYPWQDPQWFEDHSPLFRADRIHTPLLLLHGADDTNVPPGESDQLFTALRLLGREVEYVQILGQDHQILDRDRRLVWNDTIQAFFARHLLGESAWWDQLYPDPEAPPE